MSSDKPAWLGHEHRPGCTPDHGPRPVGPAALEMLEQIAQRLTDAISPSSACHEEDRASDYAEILAALREVQARAITARNVAELRAEKAEAEIARLREALKFYADRDNWSAPTHAEMAFEEDWSGSIPTEADKGQRARDALATAEEPSHE